MSVRRRQQERKAAQAAKQRLDTQEATILARKAEAVYQRVTLERLDFIFRETESQ